MAAEAIGYPLVVKPVIGSWGRLIGKVNDPDALDLALDHKAALGGAPHAVAYLQRFVETGGRDVRSFVVGGRCIAAIARTSEGWRTNEISRVGRYRATNLSNEDRDRGGG